MDPQIELLLRASAEDEMTMLLEGIPDQAFGFHAQQTIEKLLKALIAARGEQYPRIHYLEKLARQLARGGERIPVVSIDLEGLSLYALNYRYGEAPPIEPAACEDVIATVRIIREFVEARIRELELNP